MFPDYTKGRHAMNIFDHYRQRYEAVGKIAVPMPMRQNGY